MTGCTIAATLCGVVVWVVRYRRVCVVTSCRRSAAVDEAVCRLHAEADAKTYTVSPGNPLVASLLRGRPHRDILAHVQSVLDDEMRPRQLDD